MNSVEVLGYQVKVGCNIEAELLKALRKFEDRNRIAVVFSDSGIPPRFVERYVEELSSAGFSKVVVKKLSGGEKVKSLENAGECYEFLSTLGVDRKTPVAAIGGGAVTDLVGFVAATYLRGLPYVPVPSTLLGMVDASIGGKTGINITAGKNLVGSFKQPEAVICDTQFLSSLPDREMRAGLAECIKHSIITGTLDWIEEFIDGDRYSPEDLVFKNVQIKGAVVQSDEKEADIRAYLNLGHTFAHAIEKTLGYGAITHGEAVALGLCAASTLSQLLGKVDKSFPTKVCELVSEAGLPTTHALASFEELDAATKQDKKTLAGEVRYVIPTSGKGNYQVELVGGIDEAKLKSAWDSIRA